MKWYRDTVSTVLEPTNTRQNPTIEQSIPVELVLKQQTSYQLKRGEDKMMMTFNQLRMTINSILNQQKQNQLNHHHQ
jgi:hypothetical protein